ncbi:MAG: hypothetical protein LUD00_09540 [Prevotellaceae bacterium]|nr:hypothetical protein [Prevotellaceae bacterium]
MFPTDSSCVTCIISRRIRQTPNMLYGCFVGVSDRLLRRYRATSPNLGEEPIYHSLKRL